MNHSNTMQRRDFLAGIGATTLGLTLLNSTVLRAQQTQNQIRLGFIGCGNRAEFLADLIASHTGYQIRALADYFQDRVDLLGEKYNVTPERRFTTLSAYKKILDDPQIDAVVITSPPFFHPEHACAAVDAGKHVYLAKPVAVDVPGCKCIEQAGQTASQKNLCFLVDFQTRANEHYIEAVRRVHNGAIGEFVFAEASYHCDRLETKTPPANAEATLRNWVFDKTLSGDIIVEQNIHALDVMSWVLNQPPLHAVGSGGRKVRTDVGNAWDYFNLLFEYPNQVGVTFSSRQFNAQGTKPDGIRNRFFGTQGVLETHYGGQVLLRCPTPCQGKTEQIYKEGAASNIALFHNLISQRNFENITVAPSVQSNLVSILARTAAYQNRRVTWPEILRSEEPLIADLTGLKS